MNRPLHKQNNPVLSACSALWDSGRCDEFFAEVLPRLTWDMAPREFLYDAYVSWWGRTDADGAPMRQQDFIRVLEWAGWNGLLGPWTPCQRRGHGVPTRFMEDQAICDADHLDLPAWQPSQGFVPKATYTGVGR